MFRRSCAGFNTNRVAEAAGVSVGSLYQYFPYKSALITALIDQARAELTAALQALVQQTDGLPLQATLHAVANLAIGQQYVKPLLAAALDHEEKRLPVQHLLAQSDIKLLDCVGLMLQRHRAELAPLLPASAACDCLVLAKALVEADVGRLQVAPADLAQRIVRALIGYLTWRPPDKA